MLSHPHLLPEERTHGENMCAENINRLQLPLAFLRRYDEEFIVLSADQHLNINAGLAPVLFLMVTFLFKSVRKMLIYRKQWPVIDLIINKHKQIKSYHDLRVRLIMIPFQWDTPVPA